jgi:hypothetical protein
MQEAVEIARRNIKRSADYNKLYYNKKARAVEIVDGDMVLMRNVRERGGTGKLNSFWEETLFKVVEKRGEMPVYRIKNINKSSDVRVVHRNLLMKVDQLPLDVFDEVKGKGRVTSGIPTKRPQRKAKEPVTEVEVVSDSDSDGVVIVEEELFVDGEGHGVDMITPVEEPEMLENPQEQETDADPQESESEVEGSEGEVASSESPGRQESSVESLEQEDADGDETFPYEEEEELLPTRRSSRVPVAARRFTYDAVGGNPSVETVDRGGG